jgi:hypothetical protein
MSIAKEKRSYRNTASPFSFKYVIINPAGKSLNATNIIFLGEKHILAR